MNLIQVSESIVILETNGCSSSVKHANYAGLQGHLPHGERASTATPPASAEQKERNVFLSHYTTFRPPLLAFKLKKLGLFFKTAFASQGQFDETSSNLVEPVWRCFLEVVKGGNTCIEVLAAKV